MNNFDIISDAVSGGGLKPKDFKKMTPLIVGVVVLGMFSFLMKKNSEGSVSGNENVPEDLDQRLNDVGGMYNDISNQFQNEREQLKFQLLANQDEMEKRDSQHEQTIIDLNSQFSTKLGQIQTDTDAKITGYESEINRLKGEVDNLKNRQPTIIYKEKETQKQGSFSTPTNPTGRTFIPVTKNASGVDIVPTLNSSGEKVWTMFGYHEGKTIDYDRYEQNKSEYQIR